MFRTPKRTKSTTSNGDIVSVTPPNRIAEMKSPESPSPANGSPNSLTALSPSETRRGRPRAEVLNTLIQQGSTSPSSIKCSYCNRVFPREKSLQAHKRTHTGEKPYVCDFPRCTKRFAQSGQLKTHQRLHTGEKPFICSAPNCERRFTHANRHCPEHPDVQLKRFHSSSNISIDNIDDDQYKKEIQKWMDAVKKRERNSTSGCSTPKKTRTFEENWIFQETEQNENIDSNNTIVKNIKVRSSQELTYGFTSYKFHESSTGQEINYNFIVEPRAMNNKDTCIPVYKKEESVPYIGEEVEVETSPVKHTELPKKRWLREATLEQQRWDTENSQDLALPINWGEESNIIAHENQKRPTVLVKIENSDNKNISSSDMQVAMALVELGNLKPNSAVNYSY